MAAWEFREWQVYDQLFPFGDERADWRMGTLAAKMHNLHTKGPRHGASDYAMKPPQTQKQKEAGLKAALRKAGRSKKPSPKT